MVTKLNVLTRGIKHLKDIKDTLNADSYIEDNFTATKS